jgi:hypothetical protein
MCIGAAGGSNLFNLRRPPEPLALAAYASRRTHVTHRLHNSTLGPLAAAAALDLNQVESNDGTRTHHIEGRRKI